MIAHAQMRGVVVRVSQTWPAVPPGRGPSLFLGLPRTVWFVLSGLMRELERLLTVDRVPSAFPLARRYLPSRCELGRARFLNVPIARPFFCLSGRGAHGSVAQLRQRPTNLRSGIPKFGDTCSTSRSEGLPQGTSEAAADSSTVAKASGLSMRCSSISRTE